MQDLPTLICRIKHAEKAYLFYGTALGHLLADAAAALSRQSAQLIDPQTHWIDELEEGAEIELIIRARVTTDGHFTGQKITGWVNLGTNIFHEPLAPAPDVKGT
jgi:hypothetical protein